uniref:Ciliary microtubule inner protein 2A-C-like domain-containing protein n=1 Tax=Timema shepardi TaxID=629360 RepID=A0A7R9G636_TIMSH|nr:unnamed protein product [Timema shepardi]
MCMHSRIGRLVNHSQYTRPIFEPQTSHRWKTRQYEIDALIRVPTDAGYTGHCPTLKFRFGKRYGANTKDALQEDKKLLEPRGLLQRLEEVTNQVLRGRWAPGIKANKPD